MNSPERNLVQQALAFLGSLWLTVILLGLSIILVFIGTLAQVGSGIWTVMDQFFRCWFVKIGGVIPVYPGGRLLGAALLVNLLISHSARIKVQARGPRLLVGLAILAVGTALTWFVISHVSDYDSTQRTIDPSLRILVQIIQGLGPAAVLFVGCWLLFRRKAGIVLLHAGVVILMLSELYTSVQAEEGQMTVFEGQRINYVEDNRSAELAIIDASDPEKDDVVVVPQKKLEKGGSIRLEGLPFDVEVAPDQFYKNADLAPARGGDANPATQGAGLRIKAQNRAENSGVDTSSRVDLPAAYVTFKDRGSNASLGTWLTSVRYTIEKGAQTLRAGGKDYRIALRFKRTYKPYGVYLYQFKFDRYTGTDTPKDYSSNVRIDDPERNIVRDVRIWMNNPLRYRRDTLYQSSFDAETEKGTVLQVVTNGGWMAPYAGLGQVFVGLVGQFLLHLFGFLRKQLP
ncbi:MAG TPA: cytochrome c biogenesis protein ResB [Planctomycetota bacterium]|jgi:hypothetical protein|nr:cytochrome c biogenesis protein ResB [Planctomycetota bacterium]